MSNWISVKDKLPTTRICAIVVSTKGWMKGEFIRALYHPNENAWVLYDPNYRENICLEVTHYLPIPEFPNSEKAD